MTDLLLFRQPDNTASCILFKQIDVVRLDQPNVQSGKGVLSRTGTKDDPNLQTSPTRYSAFFQMISCTTCVIEQAIDAAAVQLSSHERASSLLAIEATKEPYATPF